MILKSYSAGATLSDCTLGRICSKSSINKSYVTWILVCQWVIIFLFIMNRFSDTCLKNIIERWIKRSYAFIIFPPNGSYDYRNIIDRFTDLTIKEMHDRIRDKILDLGYDFTVCLWTYQTFSHS